MATVERGENGELALNDPVAMGMIRAVGKHNCKITFAANRDRVEHFRQRVDALGLSPATVVIVVINVDAIYGNLLANTLMPDFDWQAIRDKGEIPFARGIAMKEGIQAFLSDVDKDAGDKLSGYLGVATVVVDHGVVEVF